MGVLVEPKQGSYVTEWEAVQVCGADCFPTVRKLLRGSPWVAQIDLSGQGASVVCSQVTPVGITQERLEPGDWLVRSPHGRFWFMSEAEFLDQFEVTP
jgi:hypothetical protein